jgi:hypothetical protein
MNKIDWRHMYVLAEEILALAPWKALLEDELFAIQPRQDGPIYFASIMGNQGEHHAVAYYPGLESLSQFRMAQMDDVPDRVRFELMLLNGHIQVAFEKKKYLIPQDTQILKALGKSYRGKWPAFRSHRPARMPWITGAEEAQDLAALMEQTLVILRREDKTLFQPFDMEEFFLRTWDGKDSVCRVADLPVHRHIIQAPLPPGALDDLKKRAIRLEADLVLMTTPVADVPHGEAPYFPMMLLVADSASGQVVGMELFSTADGVDSVFARIPEALTGVLKKAKTIPSTIAARHPVLLSALGAYCDAYGIDFEQDEQLLAVDEAAESIMQFMRR